MSEPLKHHFLPQFYLRGFQIDPLIPKRVPKINVFIKSQDGGSFVASVEDTGCIRDYHTIEDESGKKDRKFFEGKLSDIETLHAELIKKIIKEKKIDQLDINDLAFLILLMRQRVPNVKELIEKQLNGIVRHTGQLMFERGKLPEPPEEIKAFIAQGGDIFEGITIRNHMILDFMFNGAMSEKMLNLVSNMNFSLIRAEEGEFIASDSPVVLYLPKKSGLFPSAVGFGHKEVQVTLPFNTEYMLLASWEKRPVYRQAKIEEVREFNRRQIISAQNYIYSSRSDQALVDLIARNKHLRAGYSASRIGGLHLAQVIPVTDA